VITKTGDIMNKNLKLNLLLTILLISLNSFASIINIPADFEQIQSGISAAVWGDTILIQPGTYMENIDYLGKSITVGSLFLTTQDTTYISQTIIDGDQNGPVVKFNNNENSDAVLLGLSLINGSGKSIVVHEEDYYEYIELRGGAIYCYNAQPRLYSLKIHNNSANCGGGIYLDYSNVQIFDCEVKSNQVNESNWIDPKGGGISTYLSEVVIVNSNISYNSSTGRSGGLEFHNSTFTVQDSKIANNSAEYGGGLSVSSSNGSLLNCLVTNNDATANGGGINHSHSDLTLSNV